MSWIRRLYFAARLLLHAVILIFFLEGLLRSASSSKELGDAEELELLIREAMYQVLSLDQYQYLHNACYNNYVELVNATINQGCNKLPKCNG